MNTYIALREFKSVLLASQRKGMVVVSPVTSCPCLLMEHSLHRGARMLIKCDNLHVSVLIGLLYVESIHIIANIERLER